MIVKKVLMVVSLSVTVGKSLTAVMGRLEKVGMVSRLDDVNLVCGRGNKELLVFFMHL